MKGFDLFRFIASISIMILIISFLFLRKKDIRSKVNVRFLARTGIFASIAIILYLIQIPPFNFSVPFFPSFLKFHFDEVPVFIAGFAYGPLSALFILIIKALVKLPMSETSGVGELIDLIYSCSFVIPAVLIYSKKKNFKGVLQGFFFSFLAQVIVSSFLTTFVMLKFYMFVMGISYEVILKMCNTINPLITNLQWPFLLMVALPFNSIKNILVIVLTLLLYKRLHVAIDKIGAQKN